MRAASAALADRALAGVAPVLCEVARAPGADCARREALPVEVGVELALEEAERAELGGLEEFC